MRDFAFWQKWLVAVAVVVAVFGVAMALTSGTPLFDLFNRQIDPAFWSAGAPGDAGARQFQKWAYAVLGATTAGWGIFIVFIAREAFRRKERWAWDCMVWGLGVWFVLDTGLSALYGVYFNVLVNTVLVVLAGLPVVMTRREFGR